MVESRSGHRAGRALAGTSRRSSFAVVSLVYVLAGLGAGVVALALRDRHPLVATLGADVAATVVVFVISMYLANASLYDPYWSVAPPVIVLAWAVRSPGVNGRGVLVVALILIWAVRLTTHWANTWRGLSHEDWRYRKLREDTASRVPWWFVNLSGIQLMPTLVVFAGLLSVWPATTVRSRPLGPVDVLATVLTVLAIALEAVADMQLSRFLADPAQRGRVADRGLWRYSRHPNYLGEIGFWWGLWLFGLAADPDWWWTVLGPIAMVLLFVSVSIPLMDRRLLARRPGYADYLRNVPPLLPSFRRRGLSPIPDHDA